MNATEPSEVCSIDEGIEPTHRLLQVLGRCPLAHEMRLVLGDVLRQGPLQVLGVVVKDVVIQGSPEIYYRVPSVALTTPWQERKLRLRMVAYSEW